MPQGSHADGSFTASLAFVSWQNTTCNDVSCKWLPAQVAKTCTFRFDFELLLTQCSRIILGQSVHDTMGQKVDMEQLNIWTLGLHLRAIELRCTYVDASNW